MAIGCVLFAHFESGTVAIFSWSAWVITTPAPSLIAGTIQMFGI